MLSSRQKLRYGTVSVSRSVSNHFFPISGQGLSCNRTLSLGEWRAKNFSEKLLSLFWEKGSKWAEIGFGVVTKNHSPFFWLKMKCCFLSLWIPHVWAKSGSREKGQIGLVDGAVGDRVQYGRFAIVWFIRFQWNYQEIFLIWR